MAFKRLDPEDISISAESVVAPAWINQTTDLITFFTSSNQVGFGSGVYLYDIYQTSANATAQSQPQFSIAFGNRLGRGSTAINAGVPGTTQSTVTYGQYRTLVNGDENTDFIFGDITPDSVFVISINRSRYKEKLLPGSFNLRLTNGSSTVSLTDNSKTLTTISYTDSGRVFDIVSGSNGTPYTVRNPLGYSVSSGSYGKFLPDIGTIILNAEALKVSMANGGGIGLSVNETLGVSSQINLNTFFNIIKAGASFNLQSEETITSNYVFVRIRNGEYNYSTNPSIITGTGDLRYDVLINSPQAYMTTIGLYNDNNDLLGVAKLSKPLLKDFTKEALVRIKLDY